MAVHNSKIKKYYPILMALLFILVMSFVAVRFLFDSYISTGYDLGIFTQICKSTLQGHLLYSSMTGYSQLAWHFSPIMFLVVPIYWIFHCPQSLVVFQIVCIGFGGYLIYYIAQKNNLSYKKSLFVELLFFVNPLVWGLILCDFHEICFAIPFILLMLIAYMNKRWKMYWIFMALSLLIKEDIIASIVVFGLSMFVYDYFKTKKINRIALITIISGVFIYIVGVLVSVKCSNGEFPRMLTYASVRYSYADQTIIHKIQSFLTTFTDSHAILLILAYLLPLGFLIFGGWQYAIAGLFILAMNMASTDVGQHVILLQTTAGAIPYLFVAFIITLSKINLHKNEMIVFSFLILMSLVMLISPVSRIHALTNPNQHDADINQIIKGIPNGVSITTTNNIIDHLVYRTDAYLGQWDVGVPNVGNIQWGYPCIETQYVLVDLEEDTGETKWTQDIENGIPDYVLVNQIDGCKLYELRSDVK